MSGWAIETLLSSTLLMLLVLAARKPVRTLVGARVAYALWAIPAVRLAMPSLPEGWRGAMLPELPAATDGAISLGVPVLELPAHPATGLGWPVILVGIWAAGAVALFAWHAVGYWHFCRRLRRGTRRRHTVADGRITVIETAAAPGPLAFGILSPTIALPRDFAERYDSTERNLAMAHELGHHLRGDLFANWIAITVLAFHWFNPVAWRAFRAFRTDQEMACDETVLASRGSAIRHAYARAIVKSANGASLSVACHMHTVDDLKGRLRMLGRKGASARRRLGGGLGLTALALAGLAVTASGTSAAERMRTQVEDATGVDFAALDDQVVAAVTVPRPPMPPAPPRPPVPGAGPDAPDAPELPAAPTGPTRGEHLIISDNDTQVVVHEGRARVFVDGVAVPAVVSEDCGGGSQEPLVIRANGRTVICNDRVRTRAEAAERGARDAERGADRASRDADRASRDADRAIRDAERAAALAERDADRARDEAERQRDLAQAQAERSRELARAQAERNRDLAEAQAERARAMAERNRELARAQAERGRAMAEASREAGRAAGEVGRRHGIAAARAGLESARRSVEASTTISSSARARALASIENELDRLGD